VARLRGRNRWQLGLGAWPLALSARSAPDGDEAPKPAWWPSLRGRIIAWTTGVFGLTLGVFAVVWIGEVRGQIRDLESAQAEALLGHLAGMPDFQADESAARARLASLLPSLRRAGGDIVLVSPANESTSARRAETLASRPLSLGGRAFELRYQSDGKRLADLTKRTAVAHTVQALLAAGALLAGLWWILTRNLVAPLREICRALHRMRRGNGWLFTVPQTDAELSPLVQAVAALGPGLEEQVYGWITAERRAAVATALSSVERGVAGPLARVRAVVAEGEAETVAPEERARWRALRAELDRVSDALAKGEQQQLVRADAPSRAWGRAAGGASA